MMTIFTRAVTAAAAAITLAAPLPAARADDFLTQANRIYNPIRQDRRSDPIVLAAAAQMSAPPAALADRERAMVLPVGASGWDDAEAWAMQPEQRAALEALDQVTQIEDPIEAMAFAQPYGYEGVPMELVRAGLYSEVGDPPTLAGAKFQYLPALDRLGMLVHVEATRLAAAGDEAQAIDLLIDWLFFARQIADRAFFREVRWGVHAMNGALERIRDVAYADFRYGDKSLSAAAIAGALRRLQDSGYIDLERLRFPDGDRIAAEQLLTRTFTERGGPDPALFGPTMARLASSERPLRLFSEAARWDAAVSGHANIFEVKDTLADVYGDWKKRWTLPPSDPLLAEPFYYGTLDKARYQGLLGALPDMSGLFNDRQVLRTQLVGTRTSLGVLAFFYANGNFPPHVSAIRPRFIQKVDADPFNPARERGQEPPLQYFVPNKINYKRLSEREVPKPHTINVFTADGKYNFRILVGDDQFVLYSMGPDKEAGWAELVSGEPVENSPGDLLVWPPAISLLRQHLQESGQLK